MRVLLVSHTEVRALLPMRDCVPLMADALASLARGDVTVPLRAVMTLPGTTNAFAAMPAFAPVLGSVGAKVITVVPGNVNTPFDSHQGVVLLFEPTLGRLRAIVDATAITAIRTAAVSAVATRALARPDAGDLALLGTGVQAERHLEAMREVRTLRRVRTWSRSPARRRAFAERATARFGLRVEPVDTARAAVEGADIICTVTSSREPVLEGAWLAPGAHVNAVGASVAAARELNSDAVARARLFVDRRESALHESGDVLVPMREGRFGPEHIRGELGEVLIGQCPGRIAPDEITLFKSLGLAIEDLAAAHHVAVRADGSGAGTRVDLVGERE